MSRVAIIEYQGRCDEAGNAVGHAVKALNAYYDLLCKDAELTVYAPVTILKSTRKEISARAKVLPHHIVMKAGNSLFEKIVNKLRMFANIRGALLHADADVLWFYNVEFYLMLYLALFGAHGKRIVCTMFQDGWHGGFVAGIKQRIFERAQCAMNRIMATGPSFAYKNVESAFLPDYPYDGEVYEPYRKIEKSETAVCLGTMGAEKDIEGLVRSFTDNGYPLTVAGRFYDKERVLRLKEAAGENIRILDEYLSREEYLQKMAEARYCVLPYSSGQYATQTSGVLQEAMFLDTIPVAPAEVLKASGIPGLATERLEDTDKESLASFDRQSVLTGYQKLREEIYDRDAMRLKIKQMLCG